VLVPFPFTDHSASKRRPAAVVSNASYNSAKPDVVVMAVTSQLRHTPGRAEVWVHDWQRAGLLKPSAIKPVLTTLEQGLIIRTLGHLGDEDRQALKRIIGEILG